MHIKDDATQVNIHYQIHFSLSKLPELKRTILSMYEDAF